MRRVFVIAAGAFCLAACATPYGPKGPMGGYTDFRVSDGKFAVTVDGNGFTDRATLMQHFHRRAKEICAGEYEFTTDISTDTDITLTRSAGLNTVNRHAVTGYVTCKTPPPTYLSSEEQGDSGAGADEDEDE